MCMLRVSAVLLSRSAILVLAGFLPFATYGQSKSIDGMMNEAQTALSKGRPEEAVSILRQAINQAPERRGSSTLRSTMPASTWSSSRTTRSAI